ncbi:MAG: hypothetical protein R2847_07040 [Bacteroidia bacterium]
MSPATEAVTEVLQYASSGTPLLQYSIDNGATFQAGNAFRVWLQEAIQ